MRLFVILFLFCLTFGVASAFQWPSFITKFFGSVQDKVCNSLAKHQDCATTAIQKVNETLQSTNQTRQTFVLTINYLNSAANQQKLVGGTSTCPMFFSEIEDNIRTDLKNNNVNSTDAKQKASDLVNKFLDQLKDLIH